MNVREYGAKGNGRDDDTEAIRSCLKACGANGGGTVRFPPGTYLTACLHLTDNINLFIDAGAVLRFIPDYTAYPPVRTRWEGVECFGFSPLIYGYGLKHVALTGHGILDGQGSAWWDELRLRRSEKRLAPESAMEKKLASLNPGFEHAGSGGGGRDMQFLRPPLLQLFSCEHVLLEGLTLQNSPFWNTHLVYCNDVTINQMHFSNPPAAPNTDGLDIDSCTSVRVSDCHFDVGDDCLCLKAGLDEDGRRVGKATENIVISNCTMQRGHGGVVFGSETAGSIRSVTISNCIFDGTDRGIRMKSRRGRGGIIEDIRVSQVLMRDVLCPVAMNLYYKCGADAGDKYRFNPEPEPVNEKTPAIRNITLSHITARNVKAAAGFFYGLPEAPLSRIRLSDMDITLNQEPGNPGGDPDMVHGLEPMQGKGICFKNVADLILKDVNIAGSSGTHVCLNTSITANRSEAGFLPVSIKGMPKNSGYKAAPE